MSRTVRKGLLFERCVMRSNALAKIPLVVTTAASICALCVLSACGGGGVPTGPGSVSVTVSPNSVTVFRDATQAFTAKVTGTSNTAVTWSVLEGSGGTINSAGVYTPPQNDRTEFTERFS